ncbi:MAG: mechanosensitive ion channel family protein, partial [Planctomycetota bacterium]
MKTTLALLLLIGAALAQSDKATVADQRARNKELAAEVAKAEAAVEPAATAQAEAAAELKQVRDKLAALRQRYETDEDLPARNEVRQQMRRLRELASEQASHAERIAALQEEADHAQTVFFDTTADWATEFASFEKENPDPNWASVRIERGRLIQRLGDALSQRANKFREALADAEQTVNVYLRMRALHETKNLLLRDANTITWEATQTAATDIPKLVDWGRTSAREAGSYFEGAAATAALVRWGIFTLILMVLVTAGGLALRRYAARVESKEPQEHQQRVLRVIARFLRRALHVALIFFVPYTAATMLPDLPPAVEQLLTELARFFAATYFIWSMFRELLRPDRPERALVVLDDRTRRRITRAVRIVILVCLVVRPLELGLIAFDYENVGALDLIEAIFFLAFTYLLTGVIFRKQVFARLLPQGDAPWAKLVRAIGGLLRPFLMLLMPALLFLHLARFELLADAVTRYSIALLGSIIASSLLYQVAKAIALQAMHRTYGEEFDQNERARTTTGALLFALRVATFLFGVWFLAFLAGSTTAELQFTLEAPLPFQSGPDAATWWGLFSAVALFCFFFYGTPHAKDLLRVQVLDRTNLDSSTRYTITTLFGYVVLAVGSVVAIKMVFNLSDLGTIVAALSVGIGFGLQEIVSNFISGIILLFERPIRVGDMIEVGINRGM